jgi:hypothetical protein
MKRASKKIRSSQASHMPEDILQVFREPQVPEWTTWLNELIESDNARQLAKENDSLPDLEAALRASNYCLLEDQFNGPDGSNLASIDAAYSINLANQLGHQLIAQIAKEVIREMLCHRKLASLKQELVIGVHNFERLTKAKAELLLEFYKLILSRVHVMVCTEVTKEGLEYLAQETGMKAYCCSETSSGIAIGFLIDPRRVAVICEPEEYREVANIDGLKDLRPYYRIKIEDLLVGARFYLGGVHLKSMRLSRVISGRVRHQQAQKIVSIDGDEPGIHCGDYNTHLGESPDLEPFTIAGHELLKSKEPTHCWPSRLDGVYHHNLNKRNADGNLSIGGRGVVKVKIGKLHTYSQWKNEKLQRAVSDHSILLFEVIYCFQESALDYAKAESRKKLLASLTQDQLDIVHCSMSMHKVAASFNKKGQAKAAQALYEAALKMLQDSLGDEHGLTTATKELLSKHYAQNGHPRKAKAILKPKPSTPS